MADFSTSAVERLDLITQKVQTVIDNIPGASSGVGVDRLLFDEEGNLWVSGGDLLGGGEQGFIAEINPLTGQVIRRVDPTNGAAGQKFFSIAITKPFSCTIGAVNSFDPNRTFYEIDACETLPPK